jgi:hypothetical protein
MFINRSYSRSGSDHFHHQQKTHPTPKTALKTRLCDRFILSDSENKPNLGVFVNGARYGLLLGGEEGNRSPY